MTDDHVELPINSMLTDSFSPTFWDSPPFAINLHYASRGLVLGASWDVSDVIAPVSSSFRDPNVSYLYKKKV